MLEIEEEIPVSKIDASSGTRQCLVAVIWIDWYAYHVARFQGMESALKQKGRVAGIELVGGIGVHAGLMFREDRPQGLPIKTLMPESSWKEAGQTRLARQLWSHLSALRPQVVMIPGYYTLPAIAAALWAKTHGATSILMTESTFDDHPRTASKEWLKSILIRTLFDWTVVGGTAHARYLQKLRFPADRIVNFYDVVDNTFFHQATLELRKRDPEEFGLPRNYFLYIGRLAVEKNVGALIAAWTAYRRAGGTLSLVLVGDGPMAEGLQRAVEDTCYAKDVHFAGHQRSTKLPIYYAFAACFVLPSTREPWGLVVNEAMASSLPVLVFRSLWVR